jgi:hypothetical protein
LSASNSDDAVTPWTCSVTQGKEPASPAFWRENVADMGGVLKEREGMSGGRKYVYPVDPPLLSVSDCKQFSCVELHTGRTHRLFKI